ncbi:hypothetical protein [Rossellomorea marisflavi]|uniref:Lipoprotein n=1 Tax=Rossellomorea marisflavi TaxID=189381 RepID=A0A161RIG3_9BACI|nr:hypothetical protein [Rossellomorea marisflavi]KZE44305.1 hypothetical protein AV649_08370 [Rossellomorea marisflavi]
MRRLMICIVLLAVGSTLILTGCSSGKSEKEGLDSLQNVQKIDRTEGGEIIQTVSDADEINSFSKALEVEKWKLAGKQKDDLVAGSTYLFYRTDTVKFGEEQADQTDMKEVARITAYKEEPYVLLMYGGVEMVFEVPAEVQHRLNQ